MTETDRILNEPTERRSDVVPVRVCSRPNCRTLTRSLYCPKHRNRDDSWAATVEEKT